MNQLLVRKYLNGLLIWGLVGIVFKDALGNAVFVLPFLLSFGSVASLYGEPVGYIPKASAFISSALTLFLWPSSGWVGKTLGMVFLFVGTAYAVSYQLYGRSDFLTRNMLGIAFIGGVVGLAIFYPAGSLDTMQVLDFLLVVVLLWVALSIGKYVSLKFNSGEIVAVELPTKDVGERDSLLMDAQRILELFVEKGEKPPLVVFVSRYAPDYVPWSEIEDAVRSIVEYKPNLGGSLTPPWLRELYLQRERKKRSLLARDLLKRISTW
jgi:hypothetical protein